jgi:hypothetical protein
MKTPEQFPSYHKPKDSDTEELKQRLAMLLDQHKKVDKAFECGDKWNLHCIKIEGWIDQVQRKIRERKAA